MNWDIILGLLCLVPPVILLMGFPQDSISPLEILANFICGLTGLIVLVRWGLEFLLRGLQ